VNNENPVALKMHMPVLLKVHHLNPAAYNPNRMSPDKYEALKASIRAEGFIDPIVVQRVGMNIVGGHHRLRAIKEICIEDCVEAPDVPCIVLDLDDDQAKRLNLKLNHIKGEPDVRLLGELLSDLFPIESRADDLFKQDVVMLGFDLDFATKLLADDPVIPPDVGQQRSASESVKMVQLSFDDKQHRSFLEMIKRLTARYGTANVTDTVVAAVREVSELPDKKKAKRS
jgi:hypothetical protein